MMTPKELSEYAKVCRKHGISSLEINGVKILLSLEAPPTAPTNTLLKDEQELSEEELALYSAV